MLTIDQYLAGLDSAQKDQLERVRAIVKKLVPEAVEVISYGMPGFKYQGQYLIGYAAFKNHLSLFPTAGPVEAMKAKLGSMATSKGTVQFTVDNPVSEEIITELVNHRLKAIAEK